jgi:hypothetical protein
MAHISAIAISILAAGCGRSPDRPAASFQNYIDRQAIETTLVRYSTGLDTFDADVYASTFTEDAEFTMEGKVFRGRDEIRKIITDMKASRAARLEDRDPANDPPPIMHHVMSNAVIDIVGADSARRRIEDAGHAGPAAGLQRRSAMAHALAA